MSDVKRIVCLANSRTPDGWCVAGREWTSEKGAGGWMRPVISHEYQEVSWRERKYGDGSDPRVLDIIDIPVLRPQPRRCHTENWLLDPEHYWRRAGSYPPFELPALLDPVDRLWIDGYSSFHGRNDRFPMRSAGSVASSLRLIRVDQLTLEVFKPGPAFDNPKLLDSVHPLWIDGHISSHGRNDRMTFEVFMPGSAFGKRKRRVRGRFAHSGEEYAFQVTDPRYERFYLAKPDGSYRTEECYLTISLGSRYKGYFYKLIAAVIETGRC